MHTTNPRIELETEKTAIPEQRCMHTTCSAIGPGHPFVSNVVTTMLGTRLRARGMASQRGVA